jgi:hypothetical protein
MHMSDQANTPFVSASIGEHLSRGALAIAALVSAAVLANVGAWYGLIGAALLLAFAFFMFRGCPVCWTIGLFGTCKLKSARNDLRVSD